MRPLPLLGKKDEKIVIRAGVGERSRTDSQPSNVWSQGAERRLSAGSRPQAGLHRDQEEAQVQGHQEALLRRPAARGRPQHQEAHGVLLDEAGG